MEASVPLGAGTRPVPLRSDPAEESVRGVLRVATAVEHQALHDAAPFVRMARGDMDLAGYAGLLQALYRFHSAVAPACRAGCVAIGASDLLRPVDERLDRLRRDLAHLGVEAASMPTDPVPEGPEGFAAGCLYTVQGSTLGGKVMHGWLQGLLPTAAGREFLQGGPEDGALWRGFCANLEAYGADRGRLPAIVAGACSAFALFRSCLGGCP